jgi:hypothetical protein
LSAVSSTTLTGLLLIALPIAFNLLFWMLATQFEYPDILRRPTGEVLERFAAGGSFLILLWWSFAMTAVVLAPTVVLLSHEIADANAALLAVATTVGVLAAAVQFLGLIRWPFLVPYLARTAAEPSTTQAQREAVEVVFQSFNRYLGVAVGEHLGYGLTGLWTLLTGFALTDTSAVPAVLGVAGIAIGAALMVCSLEFVGAFEAEGWKLARALTPVVYIAWSVWLAANGLALLV